MEVRRITWRQAVARGYVNRTATFRWVNDVTGKQCHRADRLNVAMMIVMQAFARSGRTPLEPRLTMRHGQDIMYEIGLPPIPKCSRCDTQTWDLRLKRCRGGCKEAS